jgi:hypothetical protein
MLIGHEEFDLTDYDLNGKPIELTDVELQERMNKICSHMNTNHPSANIVGAFIVNTRRVEVPSDQPKKLMTRLVVIYNEERGADYM